VNAAHDIIAGKELRAPTAAAGVRMLVPLALAAVATIALTLATPLAFRAGGDNAYMVMALAAGGVALLATRLAERTRDARAFWLIVAVAVLLRAILLFVEPLLSSDIYRYVWDGRVQAAGVNPYRYFPAHEALASLRDAAIYPNINRADYAVTIYPPVAQMFFFLATRLGESVAAMKLALLAGEAITATTIVLLLRRLGRPATRIVAYLWHPLPLWEIANSGHVDALMVALMMLGLWLAFSGRVLGGGASIALAALVKPFAVFALPAVWRPWDWRLPLVVIAVFALCYAPYLSVGLGVFGFLTAGYLTEEGFDSGGGFFLLAAFRKVAGYWPGDAAVYLAAAAVVLMALACASALRTQRSEEAALADINRLLLAALFLLSPNYPWYFLALTPFVALVGGAPVWAFTLGAVLLQQEVDWDFHVPMFARKSALYGLFVAACAWAAWRAWRNRSSVGRTSHERPDAP
jgi:hypothetical protein